jgi:hypothetical protein
MTEMQTLLERLLTSRINVEKAKISTEQDFSEITNIINIFLADGKITTTQYASLTKLIILANINTNSTSTT